MKEENDEDLKNKFYKNLAWYFGEKPNLQGAVNQVSRKLDELSIQLKTLNENFVKADQSSTKLTIALNKLTKWGVIIAGMGLILGFATFIFEIIKYINQ